jgi:hypothetical protein
MYSARKIKTIDNQLDEALGELKKLNNQDNELVYDYVFEASRLVKEICLKLN